MHDHGPLPLPKEGGDFAKLIGMVNEARTHSNDMLTKLINEQNAAVAERKKKNKEIYNEKKASDSSNDVEKVKRQRVEIQPKI